MSVWNECVGVVVAIGEREECVCVRLKNERTNGREEEETRQQRERNNNENNNQSINQSINQS
jgi:hypothetical protein